MKFKLISNNYYSLVIDLYIVFENLPHLMIVSTLVFKNVLLVVSVSAGIGEIKIWVLISVFPRVGQNCYRSSVRLVKLQVDISMLFVAHAKVLTK